MKHASRCFAVHTSITSWNLCESVWKSWLTRFTLVRSDETAGKHPGKCSLNTLTHSYTHTYRNVKTHSQVNYPGLLKMTIWMQISWNQPLIKERCGIFSHSGWQTSTPWRFRVKLYNAGICASCFNWWLWTCERQLGNGWTLIKISLKRCWSRKHQRFQPIRAALDWAFLSDEP